MQNVIYWKLVILVNKGRNRRILLFVICICVQLQTAYQYRETKQQFHLIIIIIIVGGSAANNSSEMIKGHGGRNFNNGRNLIDVLSTLLHCYHVCRYQKLNSALPSSGGVAFF